MVNVFIAHQLDRIELKFASNTCFPMAVFTACELTEH